MFRTNNNTCRLASSLVLATALLFTAGCGGGGGGGGFFDPVGDVDVANLTAFEDVVYFELIPFGGFGGTGDLLSFDVFPGEQVYVGSFIEDYYEADAVLSFGGLVPFGATLVESGFTTVFDVF